MPITQEELGRRIGAARARRRLSQSDLAAAVGLAQSAISRIESGERSVDSLELAGIAKALEVSLLDLLEDRPVPEELLALAARAEEVRAPGAVESARNRIFELIRSDRLLEELAVPEQPRKMPPSLPTVRGPAKDQGRELAEFLREELGLGPGPLPDLLDVVEDLGLDLALEPLHDGLAGLCVRTDEVAVALVDSSPVVGRQRFTVAHELCHFWVGDAQPVWIDEQLFAEDRGHRVQEIRANAFAVHFLMPEEGVRRHLRGRQVDERVVVELQHTFGVSLEALLWHLANLRFVSSRMRSSIQRIGPRALALRHGYIAEWTALETERYIVRPPSRLLRRALRAYGQGLIGVERLATMLRRDDPEELRRELEDAGVTAGGGWVQDTALA